MLTKLIAIGPHFVVGTYDGVTIKIYVDGELKVSFDLNSELVSDYEVQVFLPNDFNNNTTIETIKKNINISYFSMRVSFFEPDITYHIPLIISPYGMSCWISR